MQDMTSIQKAMNGQATKQALAAQEATVSGIDRVQSRLAELVAQNKVLFETNDEISETYETLNYLTNVVKQYVGHAKDDSSKLIELTAKQQTENMIKDNNEKTSANALKSVGTMLKSILKIKAKEIVNDTRMGKIMNSVKEFVKPKSKHETKMITAPTKLAGVEGDESKQIDSNLIANTMTAGLCKVLTPIAFVEAFFKKLFPLILVAGIVLYGFITGFLNGTVADFIGTMVTLVVGAALSFIAYMIVKEMVVIGIKIACEWLKVAIEAAADWFTVPIIIATVALIGAAFIAAAALLIVIVGAAIVGVVAAVWLITKAIGKLIDKVVDAFKSLIPVMTDLISTAGETIVDTVGNVIEFLEHAFAGFTPVLLALADSISQIFDAVESAVDVVTMPLKMIAEKFKDVAVSTLDLLTNVANTVITGIKAMTTAFMGILFSMPIVGMMMGLLGSSSFTDAIAPLFETAVAIKSLLTQIVENNKQREKTYIRTSTAYDNSMVSGNEHFTTYNSTNVIRAEDDTEVLDATKQIIPYLKSVDDAVTQKFLAEQMSGIRQDLAAVAAAVSSGKSNNSKWWF